MWPHTRVLGIASPIRLLTKNCIRTIVNSKAIRLDKFELQRKQNANKPVNFDLFAHKMALHFEKPDNSVLFTEDVRAFIYGCSDSGRDMELLKKIIYWLNSENGTHLLSKFRFGPEIMRLYHYLFLPDAAYEIYMDPKCTGIFSMLNCQTILMHLLYSAGQYTECLDVFHKAFISKKIDYVPVLPFRIALAACLKKNNHDAFQIAFEYLEKFTHYPDMLYKPRSVCLIAKLSINVEEYQHAVNLIYMSDSGNYVLTNLLIIAYAKLNRMYDALRVLEEAHEEFKERKNDKMVSYRTKFEIYEDSVNAMRECLKCEDNMVYEKKFNKCLQKLGQQNLLKDKDIDTCIEQFSFATSGGHRKNIT